MRLWFQVEAVQKFTVIFDYKEFWDQFGGLPKTLPSPCLKNNKAKQN